VSEAKRAEARETVTDLLEAEARKRAIEGVTEPVYHQDKVVGTIQKYSDSLLMFLLQAAFPEKYGKPEVSDADIENLENILSELAA